MIRCGGAMSAGQGRDYYNREYSRGDYYTQDSKEIPGTWSGNGADELGLSGAIQKADFDAVLEGKASAKGRQLVAGEVGTDKHRAAWDFTASPDKSVSVMALVGGDTRIHGAVERANAKAMAELERFAMAKDKDRKLETTGNLVIASFKHESSRKLDPQLHIHNVVMNMTQRSDGKMVAIETREMYASQRMVSAVFHSELAKELKALGYEIEVREKGSIGIKGVPQELCDEFSQRRKDIEQYLDSHGQEGTRASENAAIRTREAKNRDVSREELQNAWRTRANELGIDLDMVKLKAAYRLEHPAATSQMEAQIEKEQAVLSVRHAVDHLAERSAAFHGRDLDTVALRHGMGTCTIDQIREATKKESDLIRVQERNAPSDRFTTSQAIKIEMRNIVLMREGKGTGEAVLRNQPFTSKKPLSADQVRVSQHILNNKDQVIAVEGKAGAGKTYTLEAVTKAAQEQGWNVRGFAPTTGAAASLANAGMETKTIAALIQEKPTSEWSSASQAAYDLAKESLVASQMNLKKAERSSPERIEYLSRQAAWNAQKDSKQLWIVDEAGLMSSKQASSVLEKAREAGAKVVLVGDRLQHSAVEAGKPFAYLQAAGLKAERLDEIRRQLNEPLKAAVVDASEHRTKESVARLEAEGKIREIPGQAERHRAVAQEYMQTPKGQTCLVVAPSNAERRDLNRLIREELIQAGSVERASLKAEIRVAKGWTNAEKRDVNSYQVGDHIRVTNPSKVYQVSKGEEGRVVSVDPEQRAVQLEMSDGRTVSFNPERFKGVEASTLEERRFAVGDQIQYREAMKPEGSKLQVGQTRITNGETGTIRSLDRESRKALVQMESGRTVSLDLARAQPVDHAYAVTSHSSQGKTVDRALVVADTKHSAQLVNHQQYYVSISRARHEAVVFTDSRADLAVAVSRDAGKSSALELVGQSREASNPGRQQVVDMDKPVLSREDLQTMTRTGPPVIFSNPKDKENSYGRTEFGSGVEHREGREPGREPRGWEGERVGAAGVSGKPLGTRAAAGHEQPGGRADRAVPSAADRGHDVAVRAIHGGGGGQGPAPDRRHLEPGRADRRGIEEGKRLAGSGGAEHPNHREQRGLQHQETGSGQRHGRDLGAGAGELRRRIEPGHAGAGPGERQGGLRADVGHARTSLQQSLHAAMDQSGPVRGGDGRDPHLALAQPGAAAGAAERNRAAVEAAAALRPASEAERRLAAIQQDGRIMAMDQQLKSLEQQKGQVLSQGLAPDQVRAAVQGIERQAEGVKQQLGQELKAMEPRLQAAAQDLAKVAQELNQPPPRIAMVGLKAEGARAASEFVKAASVAQQALQTAMTAGGGSQETQKAIAAMKAAIEAGQALSNPVSLAKTAVQVAKNAIVMER